LRRLLQAQVKAMPDLNFYPEPVFLAEGGGNPVALLSDSKPGYDFDLGEFKSKAWATRKKDLAIHRIQYLQAEK